MFKLFNFPYVGLPSLMLWSDVLMLYCRVRRPRLLEMTAGARFPLSLLPLPLPALLPRPAFPPVPPLLIPVTLSSSVLSPLVSFLSSSLVPTPTR